MKKKVSPIKYIKGLKIVNKYQTEKRNSLRWTKTGTLTKLHLANLIPMKELYILVATLLLTTAEPLDEWIQTGTRDQKVVRDVSYAKGLFVSVGAQVMNSEDGLNWWITQTDLSLDEVTF